MAKLSLRSLLQEVLDETEAGNQARQLGLSHAGWGRYKDRSGKITHKSVNGKLVKITNAPITTSTHAANIKHIEQKLKAAQKKLAALNTPKTVDVNITQTPTKKDASFEELRKVASKHRNVIMSKKPLHTLHFPAAGLSQKETVAGKPDGLWYGIGDSWVNWTSYEMPDWKGDNLYDVEIDYSKVLVLDTVDKMKEFERKYRHKTAHDTSGIDWKRVSTEYDGIEIPEYQPAMRMRTWYYPWDVASGCIWNPKAVKSVKQLSVK